MTYFDHNATTQPLSDALEAIHLASKENWQNPSSPHRSGCRVRAGIEKAREEMAHSLEIEPQCLTFTSGATESNNAVLSTISKRPGGTVNGILISSVEHSSVLQPAKLYFPDSVDQISVDSDGVIQIGELEKLLEEYSPKLISLIAAHNESGVLQPWREVAQICKARGIWFHCDATQWMGKLDPRGLNICSSFSFSAHKFGGPKGVGGLFSCEQISFIKGGGQEMETRGGTENFPGIEGMRVAWRHHCNAGYSHTEAESWRDEFENRLSKSFFGLKIIGREKSRLWNTSLLCLPKYENLSWVSKLDKLGFSVSTGSACSTTKEEISTLSGAIGLSDSMSRRLIRVSSYTGTTKEDWLALARAFENAFLELQTEHQDTGVISL